MARNEKEENMASITIVGRLFALLILSFSSVFGQGQTTNVQGDLSRWFEQIENENVDSIVLIYSIPFYYLEDYKSNVNHEIDTFDAMTPRMLSYLKKGFDFKSDSLIFGLNIETERSVFFRENMSSENLKSALELLKDRPENKYRKDIVCLNYELILGQDTIDQIRGLFNENTSSIALDVMELQFQKGSKKSWLFWEELDSLSKYRAYTLAENGYGLVSMEKNIVYLYEDKKQLKEQTKSLLKYQKNGLRRKHLKKSGKYTLSDGTKVEIIK